MNKICATVLVVLILSGCHENKKGSIPFLGINSKGDVIHHFINNYTSKKMAYILAKSNEEIIEGLEEASFRHQNLWTLSRVTVGLKLEAGVDVLKAVEIESSGSFELRFEPLATN